MHGQVLHKSLEFVVQLFTDCTLGRTPLNSPYG